MRTQKVANNIKIFCLSLIFSITTVQCQSQELSSDDKKIITLMVDKLSSPLPPPPSSFESNDTIISKKIVDSLLKIKMTIAIHPIMENSLNPAGLEKIPIEFRQLIKSNLSHKNINSIEGIYSLKKHSLILADTLELKKSYDFENFDMLYWFTRIWYNREKDRAVFGLGLSRSRLNGYSTIFCLEKKGDIWVVEESVLTSIW